MNLHLVSTGGTGTYAIADWAKGRLHVKRVPAHQRAPHIPDGDRVLYVFGDPRNQLLSFFRRGFMKKPYLHGRHVRANLSYLNQHNSWTLDEYLREEYDAYGLAEHLSGWLNYHSRRYDIMFARYEALGTPAVETRVRAWIGADRQFRLKKRASDYTTLTDNQQGAMKRMFADMLLLVNELPDCMEIRCC